MTNDEPANLEAKIISQALQMGISSQVEQAEQLDVEVKTDLLQAVQGQANSLSVQGQGVVQKGVRIQELEVETAGVDINLLRALTGQFIFNKPLDSKIRLLLTEADLNQALSSQPVLEILSNFTLYLGNSPLCIRLKSPLKMSLPEPRKLEIQGWMICGEAEASKLMGFTAIITILINSQQRFLNLEEFRCQPGQGISIQLASALIQRMESFFNHPVITLENMLLRTVKLNITKQGLALELETQIRKDPD